MECVRCGAKPEQGEELCYPCHIHLEYHSSPCVDCFPRTIKEDGQDWWRGYHSRDFEFKQLVFQLDKLKREIKIVVGANQC